MTPRLVTIVALESSKTTCHLCGAHLRATKGRPAIVEFDSWRLVCTSCARQYGPDMLWLVEHWDTLGKPKTSETKVTLSESELANLENIFRLSR